VERTLPSSGYFDPDAQPPKQIPYTPNEPIARISRIPALTLPIAQVCPDADAPNGMIA
jgi:hypothetical protein